MWTVIICAYMDFFFCPECYISVRNACTRVLLLSIGIRSILHTGNDWNNVTHVRATARSPTCSVFLTPFEFRDIENRGCLPCATHKAPWRTCYGQKSEQRRFRWQFGATHCLSNPFDAEDASFMPWLYINAILSVITTKERTDRLHQVCHEDVEEVIVRVRLRWPAAEYECPALERRRRIRDAELMRRRAQLETHCDVKQGTGHCDGRHAGRLDYEQNPEASRRAERL